MPQNFNDLSLRIASVLAVIRNFHNDLMPRHGTLCVFSGNKNILRNLLVIRYHKAIALAACLKCANNPLLSSFQNPYNYAICLFALFRLMQHLIQHSVLLHRAHRFALRNKNILASCVGCHKSKPSGVSDKCPRCHLQILRRSQLTLLCFKYTSLCNQLIDEALKFFSVLLRHRKHRAHISALYGNISFAFHICQNPFFSFL